MQVNGDQQLKANYPFNVLKFDRDSINQQSTNHHIDRAKYTVQR